MTTHSPSTRRVESGSAVFGIARRVAWLLLWTAVTAIAWFQVVKYGYAQGDWAAAALLTTVAVGSFIAPDLTFLIGAGETVEKGSLPKKAVPFYNALHRPWAPLLVAVGVGIGFTPLTLPLLALFVGGLSWLAHVALDRAAGYGLRNPDGTR